MTTGMTLVVVDVPNVTGALYQEMYITWPAWDKLADWAWSRAVRSESDLYCYAFVNVPHPTDPTPLETREEQIIRLLGSGYDVVVNDKVDPEDDVDQLMLDTIHNFIADNDLREAIIVSHDMNNFADIVSELEALSIVCTIVAFSNQISRRHPFVSGVPHTLVSPADIRGFIKKVAPGTVRPDIQPSRPHYGPPTPLPRRR